MFIRPKVQQNQRIWKDFGACWNIVWCALYIHWFLVFRFMQSIDYYCQPNKCCWGWKYSFQSGFAYCFEIGGSVLFFSVMKTLFLLQLHLKPPFQKAMGYCHALLRVFTTAVPGLIPSHKSSNLSASKPLLTSLAWKPWAGNIGRYIGC